MDVHARSTHGAAIDSLTGELQRVRFGGGSEEVVAWLTCLRAPVRAVYEAGPTGFGLARAAQRAGIEVMIAAPSKTPRAPGERVKTDRRDAELLARLLLAGQLKAVTVPPDWLEAIRHLARVREHTRRDLSRNRQRVSKLLLVEGRATAHEDREIQALQDRRHDPHSTAAEGVDQPAVARCSSPLALRATSGRLLDSWCRLLWTSRSRLGEG